MLSTNVQDKNIIESASATCMDRLNTFYYEKNVCYAHLRIVEHYLLDQQLEQPLNVSQTNVLNVLSILRQRYQQEHAECSSFFLESVNTTPQLENLMPAVEQWREKCQELNNMLTDLANITFRSRSKLSPALDHDSEHHKIQADQEFTTIHQQLKQLFLLEVLVNRSQIQTLPRWMVIDQNSTCNFKCRMCFVHAYGQRFFPGFFTAINNINQAAKYAELITLGGTGEPLLHPDLSELVKGVTNVTQVAINTNGSLMDRYPEKLAAIDLIYISFDGANQETFETIRYGGSFKKVADNVYYIRKKYPEKAIYLNITVSRLNVDELFDIAVMAAGLGITGITMNAITVNESIDFLALQRSDWALYQEQLQMISLVVGNQIKVGSNLTIGMFAESRSDTLRNKADLLEKARTEQCFSTKPKADWEHLAMAMESFRLFSWWPDQMQSLARPVSSPETDFRPHYQSSALGQEIELLETQLRQQMDIQLPYCIMPWVMFYTNFDATVRPCCFHQLGDSVLNQNLEQVWNGPLFTQLRQAMLGQQPLPKDCQNCTAAMKDWRLGDLIALAKGWGFEYHEENRKLIKKN